MSAHAIGELIVAGRRRGTAFAVTEDLLLTCWHCVADPGDLSQLSACDVVVRFADGVTVSARFLQNNPELDLALFGILPGTPLPPDWTPLPLAQDTDGPRGTFADVIGWPMENPSRSAPQAMPGQVENNTTMIDSSPSLEVFSKYLAAGLRPRGFSGAPVLVRTPAGPVVIGVVRWMKEDSADSGVAVGGTIYASRAADIAACWRRLRPEPTVIADLVGSKWLQLSSEVERFVTSQLIGPGGDLPFAGRSSELAALTRWFDEGDTPYHVVAGPAGIGKSTLLVRWCAEVVRRRQVRVVLLPISVRYETNAVADILQALSSRLARVHGEDYNSSAYQANPRGTALELLQRSAPADTSVIVVLDGLDEARDQSSWLRLFPRTLGERVRILVSARHTLDHPTGQAWAGHLGLTSVDVTTLTPLGPAAMADLLSSVRVGAPAEELAAAANRLWDLTRGEPVTTSLYLTSIQESSDLTLTAWTAAKRNTAPGLKEFFEEWWFEQQKLWNGSYSAQDADRVLRILVMAEGPLSRKDLRLLVRRLPEPLDAVRLDDAIGVLGRFMLPGRTTDSLSVAHPVITEMMRARLHVGHADDELQEVFVAWGTEMLTGLRSGTLTTADVPDYLTRHLAEHLTTGDRVRPTAFDLAAPFWRRHKDATSDTTEAFQTDVRLVMEQARRADQARFDRGEAPRLLPERIMCAAEVAGQQGTIDGHMTSLLAAELVRHGLWRIGRALDFVERNAYVSGSDRVDAVVALAPVIAADHLDWLEKLVDSTLKTGDSEEKARAVAAWAVRLLELGHVSEALVSAHRLPTGDRSRSFVAVWVLAELIPRLPDDLASTALAAVFAELLHTRTGDKTICYAVTRLTKQVSLDEAERLWNLVEIGALSADVQREALRAQQADDPSGPRAVLIAAVSRDQWRERTSLTWPRFVAVARWLPDERRGSVIRSFFEAWEADESGRLTDDRRQALLPGIHYDGLLSVVPISIATNAVEWVRRLTKGHTRLACLAQLLPVLDDGVRRQVADEIFKAAHEDLVELDGSYDGALVAVAGLVAVGDTDRLLGIINTLGPVHFLGRMLAPEVTAGQARVALAAIPAWDLEKRHLRNAFLARLASFGPREAAEVLAQLSAAGPVDALPGDLLRLLRDHLGGNPEGEIPPFKRVNAWWPPGDPYPRREAVRSYWPRPRPMDEGGLHRALRDTDADPYSVLRTAMDLTSNLRARHVPMLIERSRALPDRWLGLVLLAAGTHLPPGDATATVMTEIRSTIDSLRAAADATGRPWWFTADSAWYAHNPSDIAPFFARLVAPQARADIASWLFDDGYLHGVISKPMYGVENVDMWARDAAGVTPLLDVSQLNELAALGDRSISSGGTRAVFEAGLAVGYAVCGELDRAHHYVKSLGGPEPHELRCQVLADIMYLLRPADLVGWIAQVHAIITSAYRRGPLWAHLECRLGELSNIQMWAALDQWLSMPHRGSRAEVLADALLYRFAIARITGGIGECARLLSLIDEREAA
ncbi:serine protease [Lentzea sp. BCCO 10_0061]|uniref:Serine protease n=1 Tax=Lentzea sokolovensis TaxID=3095429 RepID=A0ABU4VCL2_9PSEU|nr:serine protease [Lentzea sp. BCCO 10_0061]MDX8149515.1 serine protease [Lentzea sp. BCCO 10_0061]